MLYAIYIPKKKGETEEFNVTKVIKEYLKLNSCCDGVICSPGYSNRTASNHIEFWKRTFPKDIVGARNFKSWIIDGMNSVTGTTEFKEAAKKINHISFINEGWHTKKDHRKMIAFFSPETDDSDDTKRYGHKFFELNSIDAILIGSSNQSYNTYLRTPANKGESDLMLIATENTSSSDDSLKEFVENVTGPDMRSDFGQTIENWAMLLRNVRITKDITPKGYDTDKKFLTDIAKEMVL